MLTLPTSLLETTSLKSVASFAENLPLRGVTKVKDVYDSDTYGWKIQPFIFDFASTVEIFQKPNNLR